MLVKNSENSVIGNSIVNFWQFEENVMTSVRLSVELLNLIFLQVSLDAIPSKCIPQLLQHLHICSPSSAAAT